MIELVPYNPAWPVQFQAEAFSIQQALGPLALRVEHVALLLNTYTFDPKDTVYPFKGGNRDVSKRVKADQ